MAKNVPAESERKTAYKTSPYIEIIQPNPIERIFKTA